MFSLAVMPTQKLNYYVVSVYRCTVHVYGKVTFNNVLHKIWSLPRRCHTGILHSVANLYSVYNVVVLRSKKLSLMACNSPSSLLSDISECKTLAYTSVGYNLMYGHRHIKSYTEQERLCSSFIRILRLFPDLNRNLL